MEDEKAILLARKKELHDQLVPLYKVIRKIHRTLDPIEDQYNQLRLQHTEVDRKLALIDGRMKVVTASAKKGPAVKKFTPSQIKRLLEALGEVC